MYGPGFYNITAFTLVLEHVRFLYVPFQSEASYFPQFSKTPGCKSHWFSKPNALRFIFQGQDPWNYPLELSVLWGYLYNMIILKF